MPVGTLTRSATRHLPAPIQRLLPHLRHRVRAKGYYERGYAFAANFDDRQPAVPEEDAPPNQLEQYFDVHLVGPGIWKWRHYFAIYDRHFRKFVGRTVDVVEIGVFSGGSFMMWREYFGSQAQLHGVDIQPACRVYAGDGLRIFIGDQADPGFWRDFLREVPAFDIVIDDGGHEAREQVETLEALLPHLRPGGVFLCEDIHSTTHVFHAYIAGLSRYLHAQGTHRPPGLAYDALPFQSRIDSIHLYPFVTVIEKREAPVNIFEAPKHGTEWQPFYEAPAGL